MSDFQEAIRRGIPTELPTFAAEEPEVARAPRRPLPLSLVERRLALANALRYFPRRHHALLAEEFAQELQKDGRIYMRRYRPHYSMFARPLDAYPAQCADAAAIMLMINNNLDPAVAQYPYELITYGGNGAVFQNWAQYLLTMKYLSEMSDEQTLVLYSGHPMGLFPSHKHAPRLVVTNGMVIPSAGTPEEYERLNALGVTSYGQMTAGSFMYIGPQGIVHGTVITLLNAGRKYLGLSGEQRLGGRLFVSSGLGGMSGAQAKAAAITGAIGIIAEVDPAVVQKRYEQGWVQEVESDLDRLCLRIDKARRAKEPLSLAYAGNVVDLWEGLDRAGVEVDLGSDQTSLHNPFGGGYYPAGYGLEESRQMISGNPELFKERVQSSLRRHVEAINRLSQRGMNFWDYGNAFLLEASRAGASVAGENDSFLYPSYVEDIMGPLCFDHGFGPFRWVCTSGAASDLQKSDALAARILGEQAEAAPPQTKQQLLDNKLWIEEAEANQLVVGSQARILYADASGRIALASAFNQAIASGNISAPIVLGRDHHDVSGTDSPYRETANIKDGSNRCADMAVHNVIGDAFRGASWVSLHNGGGVGWGEVINGGFGLLLDGSESAERRLSDMLHWDVNNGVARRAWAGNEGARFSIERAMESEPRLKVTLGEIADPALLKKAFC